jgi:hypothetical protein
MRRKFNGKTVQTQGVKPWVWPASLTPRRLLVIALLLSACTPSGENGQKLSLSSQGGNYPPVIRSLAVQPIPLVLSGRLSVMVQAQDQDRDPIHFRYRWFANGKLVAERAVESVESGLFKRGDQVEVEVVPSDGKAEGAAFKSALLIVENTPPIVSNVAIKPDEESFARRVVAKTDVTDPDGDPVTMVYRWKQNNTLVKEGDAAELDITGFSAKDMVQVEVVASDGMQTAKPVSSPVFAMSNTAPKVTSSPTALAPGGIYEYRVVARDLDDDPISYKLEIAPPGMTIDSQSGILRWAPASGTTGTHHVRVVAQDGRGGFATQEFDLSFATASQPS